MFLDLNIDISQIVNLVGKCICSFWCSVLSVMCDELG